MPGAISKDNLDSLRKADVVYLDEIRRAGPYGAIWQALAVLLPIQTVGVMGDGRTYDFVCALRAVTSTDDMNYGDSALNRPGDTGRGCRN